MPSARISGFHCDSCADQTVEQLTQLTQAPAGSISYDEAAGVLTWPESVDTRTLRRLLAGDKVSMLDEPAATGDIDPRVSTAHNHGHDAHSHGHDAHSHGRGHSHVHGKTDSQRIGGVFALNLGFSAFEFIAGSVLNSVAIQADAIHDLGDALSIGLAWFFERISRRHPSHRYSFGYRRFSLLGALITSLILVAGSLNMITQSVPRLIDPQPVGYEGMTWIALAAIAINLLGAFFLRGSHGRNARILNLHLLEDVLGWVGILVISLVMRWRPLYVLDPIVSLLIAAFILWNAVPELIRTVRIMLESVPDSIDLGKVEELISGVPGVHGMNHLHIWSMDGEQVNLNVTVFTEEAGIEEQEQIKDGITRRLAPYRLACSTVQIDYDPDRLMVGYCGHDHD